MPSITVQIAKCPCCNQCLAYPDELDLTLADIQPASICDNESGYSVFWGSLTGVNTLHTLTKSGSIWQLLLEGTVDWQFFLGVTDCSGIPTVTGSVFVSYLIDCFPDTGRLIIRAYTESFVVGATTIPQRDFFIGEGAIDEVVDNTVLCPGSGPGCDGTAIVTI